jgi:hypothetical protein
VRDLWPRLLLSPILGVGIGLASGLVQPAPDVLRARAWPLAGLSVVAFLVWEGNRRLYFRMPPACEPLDRPSRRLALVTAVLGGYTIVAATTLLLLWRWQFGDPAPDIGSWWKAVGLALAAVSVIALGYETAFLRRVCARERVRAMQLEQAHLQAQLAALQRETDPHLLYNHLNSLLHLIECSPATAAEFVSALASAYRRVLETRREPLVPLDRELLALQQYGALVRIRFKQAVRLEVARPAGRWWVPPTCLEELVENAVKHSAFDECHPLVIRFWVEGGQLCVSNRFCPRTTTPPSLGVGLANLQERLLLTVGRGAEWGVEQGEFVVRIPLAAAPIAQATPLDLRVPVDAGA